MRSQVEEGLRRSPMKLLRDLDILIDWTVDWTVEELSERAGLIFSFTSARIWNINSYFLETSFSLTCENLFLLLDSEAG